MANDNPADRDALVTRVAELEAEVKFGQQSRNIHAFVTVSKDVIRYGAIVLIFFFIYKSIAALAGETTLASIGIGIWTNIPIVQIISLILAGMGVTYGLNQRRVRKNTVERFQPRIIELETRLDPNRSSSLLTPRGDTNPGDR